MLTAGGATCTLAANQQVEQLDADLAGCTEWIFCGHADVGLRNQPTLGFIGADGKPAVLDPDRIVGIVRPHVQQGSLRCVVLNGCSSYALGLKLVREAGVECVLCWE